MKKFGLLLVVLTLLVVSSVVSAYEMWEECGGSMNPGEEYLESCRNLGGTPMCSFETESSYSYRCDWTEHYANVPTCRDDDNGNLVSGYVNINVDNPSDISRVCPTGTTWVKPSSSKSQQNILPPVPEALLTALFGPVGTTPYLDVVNVPEEKVLIVRTQANRGPLRFDSEIIKGWTADLNMPLTYVVSKRCIAEAIAEKPMNYRLIPATFQEDDAQYWLRCTNEQPIIVNCAEQEVVTPQQLQELRIEEPWKNFLRITSRQGDPWAFKPILDEEGNILAPSPKLGFELK